MNGASKPCVYETLRFSELQGESYPVETVDGKTNPYDSRNNGKRKSNQRCQPGYASSFHKPIGIPTMYSTEETQKEQTAFFSVCGNDNLYVLLLLVQSQSFRTEEALSLEQKSTNQAYKSGGSLDTIGN
jgi:hypothetical protein